MTMGAEKAKIRDFIGRTIRHGGLSDDDDIFGLGFVNSLFATQLVAFVEKEFGITIDNEDLDIDNFKTINALANLVDRKTRMIAR